MSEPRDGRNPRWTSEPSIVRSPSDMSEPGTMSNPWVRSEPGGGLGVKSVSCERVHHRAEVKDEP